MHFEESAYAVALEHRGESVRQPKRVRFRSLSRQFFDRKVLFALLGYFLIYLGTFALSFNQQDHFSGAGSYDGISYLSHAFTIGLDGDLDYRNEVIATSSVASWNPSRTAPTHPMGTGILAAPFVAGFSLIDRANHHPVLTDRTAYVGSWSYFGIQFATAFYFLAGIALYQIALRRWVSPVIVAVAVISAGLLFYVSYRFCFVHAYEFFTLAMLTAACIGLCRARERWQIAALVAAIGAATFLALMVRWVNYGALAVPALAIITHYLIEGPQFHRGALLASYAGVVAGMAAVALFHLWAFGIVWPTPKFFYDCDLSSCAGHGPIPGGPLSLSRAAEIIANLPLIIFSSEFGVIWTFPVLPIGILIGLFMFLRYVRRDRLWAAWAMAFTWCIGVPLGIALLWQSNAMGYGYRYLLPAIPAVLLALALFVNARTFEVRYSGDPAWTAGAIPLTLIIFFALSLVSFVAQVGFLKLPGFTVSSQVNVFGMEDLGSARGYMDAVFGAIAHPSQWAEIFRQSLFLRVTTPAPEMRAMPQLVDQFRIILLVIPLIGAVLSAGAYAHDWRRFATTSALVGLAALLMWPFVSRAVDMRERPLETITLGTPDAKTFLGPGFQDAGHGIQHSWITAKPAELHGLLPNARAIEVSARFYNPHPGQVVHVLLNGREVGRWAVGVGLFEQSSLAELKTAEAGQPATIQFLVERIEPFEGSGEFALGVMVYSVGVMPAKN
jgi:hypothetical protein